MFSFVGKKPCLMNSKKKKPLSLRRRALMRSFVSITFQSISMGKSTLNITKTTKNNIFQNFSPLHLGTFVTFTNLSVSHDFFLFLPLLFYLPFCPFSSIILSSFPTFLFFPAPLFLFLFLFPSFVFLSEPCGFFRSRVRLFFVFGFPSLTV